MRYAFFFFAPSGNWEIGMMQLEHPESCIAVSEKVVPLTVKVAQMNRDCCVMFCFQQHTTQQSQLRGSSLFIVICCLGVSLGFSGHCGWL